MDAALPRYLQVSEELIRDVAAGRLPDGGRLPPEREMAITFGVSLGTLRKALGRLEEMGLIERVQGSGNYVRQPSAPLGLYAFFRIECMEGGGLPTAELLEVARRPKAAGMPDFGPAAEALRIRRLRRVGGTPAVLEEIWLDGAAAGELDRAPLSESLYHDYRERLGLVIARVEDRIGLGPVPVWAPAALTLAAGATAGFVERVSRTAEGARVEYSRTWFDASLTRYVSRLR